jgi:putative transposase
VGWSLVYLGLCRLLELVALLCRSERSKELEILLRRHELAILRRQPRRAPVRPVDRAVLAALTEARRLYEHHHIRSSIAATSSAG